MMLGDKYYGWAPANGTRVAKYGGEISFYIKEGMFDNVKGQALNPEWYENNRGQFDIFIVVWRDRNWEYIHAYLDRLAQLNPENLPVRRTLEQADDFKTYYIARMETEKELEQTRIKLSALKGATASEASASGTTEIKEPDPDATGTVEVNSKDARIARLEAEREKSARLARELESRKEQADADQADRMPPYLLLASPKDGVMTSAAKLRIAGVAEDDQGLQKVEILVNGRLLPPDQDRGIVMADAPPVRRREFDQSVALEMGRNTITIRAIDTGGRVSEKTLAVQRNERRRNIWAAVVGIDAYRLVPQLKYAVRDAQAVYQLLTVDNQVPAENVTLLLDEQATLTNLRSLLGTRIKQNAGKDDMVIIYFAGHGATERDLTSPDGDGLEKYILPYDANPKDLYASALPMREISHILNRIRSERLVFIADACYSGASGGRTISIEGFRANLSDAFLNRIAGGKGRVIMTASGPNEVSAEDDRLQHGVFTYYLMQGLQGRADYDRDGLITVDEAYRYVSDAVPKATAQEQHPVKTGSVEGQLVLGIAN